MFCFVDHFEPQWHRPDYQTEVRRVDRWITDYPKIADRHKDADGVSPQHSFFYPEEEYREEHLTQLADLCGRGYGEIEVHLHHHNDTADNFRTTLQSFVDTLHEKHGAFTRDPQTGKLAWAFIHGNWSLCNSLPEGIACGVNEELPILRELGCYCDMTLPSAPSPAQTRTINSIYYAEDKPGKPKSHDTGVPVRVGGSPSGDLMIIQGPLALNFRKRKHGILPAVENGDVKQDNPPTRDRIDLWVKAGVHVAEKPDWIFVKIHTHGAQEGDMETCLGSPSDDMYDYLETRYNDGKDYVLHYVTARELYNIVKAAEAGESGNPSDCRNYRIPRPTYNRLAETVSKETTGGL
ncbi:MAG: hypothetical protein ACR2PA_16990 [Hyphomicrobiaceae bacterium]